LKLERHEITTIRELTWLTETELLKKRGIGKTVIADINEKLFAVGLCLGMVKS
jgi:DNA-directed RNA polymerase alpha subunit